MQHEFVFTLDRTSGALGEDAPGNQRMQMLGLRPQGRNTKKLAKRKRRQLEWGSGGKNGKVDAYVVQFDDERFRFKGLECVLESISKCMHQMLPSTTARLAQALEGLPKYLITADAAQFASKDFTVNNYGVSAAYQSPSHTDADVGWTHALALK
jgi:hypothetical protein